MSTESKTPGRLTRARSTRGGAIAAASEPPKETKAATTGRRGTKRRRVDRDDDDEEKEDKKEEQEPQVEKDGDVVLEDAGKSAAKSSSKESKELVPKSPALGGASVELVMSNPHVGQKAPPRDLMTPARMTRLDEKNQLQELNRRLEYYILLQRERDASLGSAQRELDVVRDNAERELTSIKKSFEDQISRIRVSRDETNTLNAQLSEEKSRYRGLPASPLSLIGLVSQAIEHDQAAFVSACGREEEERGSQLGR